LIQQRGTLPPSPSNVGVRGADLRDSRNLARPEKLDDPDLARASPGNGRRHLAKMDLQAMGDCLLRKEVLRRLMQWQSRLMVAVGQMWSRELERNRC